MKLSKKELKQAKADERFLESLEMARAKEIGVDFPLSTGERQEWDNERLAQSRYYEMRELLVKGDKLNTPPKGSASKPKPYKLRRLPWLRNAPPEVVGQPADFHITFDMQHIKKRAEFENDDGMGEDYDDIIFNFSGECCDDIGFDKKLFKGILQRGYTIFPQRAVVRIQFSSDYVRHLYIGEEELYSAIIGIGNAYDDDPKRCILLFERESGNVHYVEPEEICVLSVTGKDKDGERGYFTLFRKRDELFVDEYIKGAPSIKRAEYPKKEVITPTSGGGDNRCPHCSNNR